MIFFILKLTRIDRNVRIPLSFSQERLYFIDQYHAGVSVQYNDPLLFKITGDFNTSVFNAAVQFIIERHEIYRTTFHSDNGDTYQVIHPFQKYDIQINSLNENQLHDEITNEVSSPFDLSKLPLFKVTVYDVLDSDYLVLLINQHHIVGDGYSYMRVLLPELSQVYNSLLSDRDIDLEPLKIQYADFAVWQRNLLTEEKLSNNSTIGKKN